MRIIGSKNLIQGSQKGLSQGKEAEAPLVSREALSVILLTLGITGGPALFTISVFSLVSLLGFGPDVAWTVFWISAFASYVIFLPLMAGMSVRRRERKQEIVGEMMAFFSAKIMNLYTVSEEIPVVAEDPRSAEAFTLYSRANRQIEENLQNPLHAQEAIERGVFLVDELISDYRAGSYE